MLSKNEKARSAAGIGVWLGVRLGTLSLDACPKAYDAVLRLLVSIKKYLGAAMLDVYEPIGWEGQRCVVQRFSNHVRNLTGVDAVEVATSAPRPHVELDEQG
jgi:hypothetical protein